MKIIFLCPSFYPQFGGVEKHVFEVAKRLSKKHKVMVLAEGEKDSREEIKGINVHRLYFGEKNWLKKFRIWKKLLEEKQLFKGADIIHCHDVFFWYLPLRFIFPKKRVYTTFHGYETNYPPKFKAVFIRKLSERLSRGNICVGEFIKKWYGTKPTYITYGGVNWIRNSNSKIRRHTSKLKILFVGRLEKDTGVEIYSEVLKRLKNYQFQACGDGPLRQKLEDYGKVLGFVPNPEDYIERSDIVFASSYLSILSGLKMKKPVFSVYQNSLKKDYLKMTPFLKWISISNSPDNLLQKINLLRRGSKALDSKTEKGYNWVKNETWNKVTSLYYELYQI